jgi:hypothetical protein
MSEAAWSSAGSSNGPGHGGRHCPFDRRGRGRRAGAKPAVGAGDDDQGDEDLQPVASLTSPCDGPCSTMTRRDVDEVLYLVVRVTDV